MSQEMRVSFPGGKRVHAHYDAFEIETDQAPDSGGEGAAPEPYDLFLASLATCAGIYILSFCQRRDLPLDGIEVYQSWERQEEPRRMARISIRIETPPEFPAKYLKALERAVHQCAVKKTILDPPEFVVEAVQKQEEAAS